MGLNSHCLIGAIVILTEVEQNVRHPGLTCAQIEKHFKGTLRMITGAKELKLVAKKMQEAECELAVSRF